MFLFFNIFQAKARMPSLQENITPSCLPKVLIRFSLSLKSPRHASGTLILGMHVPTYPCIYVCM
jgi:hypothetical protein